MLVYRLCKKKYENDISGSGSIQYPGRWNMEGSQMLYTSENSSLSILEVAVHYRTISKIAEYTLIIIEIPEKYFSIIKFDVDQLPDRWDGFPLNSETQAIGTKWIQNRKSLLLSVPSAINPHEYNILINPLHSAFQNIKTIKKQTYNLQKKLINRLL
ncbi:MAG: RES family NAD+ phosphorylase [Spirochaetales bacterium]|nr:RES family NAD+ phosphorylase [Spirochaetales bacterium]